jgi:16S rRNA (guanine(966)-N(2))-methyltransferase RsmD
MRAGVRSDARPAQRVRIIGGHWRRRLISFPALDDLRPTPDRVRETLFNWLGQDLHGLACLDLFAGSGALGFEAASRGARRVVMVEQDLRAVRSLEASRDLLGSPPEGVQIEVVRADALAFLEREARRSRGAFDIVFLDPPFRLGLLPRLLPLVDACLAPGGWVYVESPVMPASRPPADAAGTPEDILARDAGDHRWTTLREARAGAVDYRLLGRAADHHSG